MASNPCCSSSSADAPRKDDIRYYVHIIGTKNSYMFSYALLAFPLAAALKNHPPGRLWKVRGVALPRVQDAFRAAGLVSALRQGGLTQVGALVVVLEGVGWW